MSTVTFDTRKFLKRLERRIDGLDAKAGKLDMRLSGERTLIKWLLGLLLAGVASILVRAFFA